MEVNIPYMEHMGQEALVAHKPFKQHSKGQHSSPIKSISACVSSCFKAETNLEFRFSHFSWCVCVCVCVCVECFWFVVCSRCSSCLLFFGWGTEKVETEAFDAKLVLIFSFGSDV